MATVEIQDRGRGPEIVGTRITVYNLLPYFLEPSVTEDYLCRTYELTAEQVAAARAYVLNNAETVFARHCEIEARIAEGNPAEVVAQFKRARKRLQSFKEWLAHREEIKIRSRTDSISAFPSFPDWLAQREAGTTGQ